MFCLRSVACPIRVVYDVRVGAAGQLLCANGVDAVIKSGEDGDERSGRFSSSLIFTA